MPWSSLGPPTPPTPTPKSAADCCRPRRFVLPIYWGFCDSGTPDQKGGGGTLIAPAPPTRGGPISQSQANKPPRALSSPPTHSTAPTPTCPFHSGLPTGCCSRRNLPGGGGGGWHVAFGVLFSSAAGGANRPIAIRCPSLGPFPSVGGGAHRPLTALCPSSPSLAYLSLSTSLFFPLAFPSRGGGRGVRSQKSLCT